MDKKKKIGIFVIAACVLILIIYLFINGIGRVQLASLEVNSNITTTVFVDGREVGQTHFTGTFPPKEIVLALGGFETKLNLEPRVKTIIDRDFGKDGAVSAGEIISFEPTGGGLASLSVISNPDGAKVLVDGTSKGFTPINIDLDSGSHKVTVDAENYVTRSFSVNAVNGYKLIAIVDLAPLASTQTKTQNVFQNQNQILVEILSTPTGFLRVRDEPSVAANEIGEVHPGDKFPLIKIDDKSGWYDVALTASSSGWITNTYAATVSGSLR